MSFPAITQRDRLADVRTWARELRNRRERAREFHRNAREAAGNYRGDGPIEQSEEFMRLQRAVGDLDEIGAELELTEQEERYVLSQMAGVDGPVGKGSFLRDPSVLQELQRMAYSEGRVGRQDLGFALSRDEYLAAIQRTLIYERPGMMAAAGDVSVPANARTT
jgi:hypothetical protein